MRIPFFLAASLALGLALPPAAAAADKSTTPELTVDDPSVWGPYDVGVATVTFYDPSRDNRPITTEIWYPTTGVPEDHIGEYYLHVGWGQALRDATPLADQQFPLLAFSHGNGGTRVQNIFQVEHLASHGYIVAAPDHFGNTFYGYQDSMTAPAAVDRPLDISFMLDELLDMNAQGALPVPGTIDPDRIAMSGHSYGAYTTMVISGAQLDINVMNAECASGDNDACDALAYGEAVLGELGDYLDLGDRRIKASLPMSPALYAYMGAEGVGQVFTPMAVMGAGKDDITPWDTETVPFYEAMSTPKHLLGLDYRGHYAYSSAWDVRPFAFRCQGGYEECSDRDRDHVIINTLSTAFLGYYLKGEAEWLPYLETSYYTRNWPGRVTYDTTAGQ